MGCICNSGSEDESFCNSIHKIDFQGKTSFGFLIKLIKDNEDFFCLITSGLFGREKSGKFLLYLGKEEQPREIELNLCERFIEDLKKINIDTTVIEIISKDKIPLDYFLLPDMDYEEHINKLMNKEIITVQNQSWKLYSSKGKIISVNENEFDFSSTAPLNSSGFPIFLKNSPKVIGISKISPNANNRGSFIMPVFNFFKNYDDIVGEKLDGAMQDVNINLIDIPVYKDYTSEKKNINLNNLPNNKLNQMTINYLIERKDDKIRLFCGEFVKNNENNCYLIIDNKIHELCNYLILNETQRRENMLEIKLVEYKPITNMGFMFYECSSLISVPDINNWNVKYVEKMNSMFSGCNLLQNLPKLSGWDTKKVTDMSCMFAGCASLKYLGDMKNWDTRNVTKMKSMFAYCKSLEKMPDISNWDTKNVINMNWMFLGCESLRDFPDISKWKLNSNLQKMMMFEGCPNHIIPKKFKL